MIIGPRQMTGVSLSTRKPIDMTFTPWFSIGRSIAASPSPVTSGRPPSPIISGTEGP